MRLIDGDALWERLDNEPWFDNADRDEIALPIVSAEPTVDAEVVVRCKDCKYRIYKDMGEEIGEIGGCALFNCAMTNDDFCSYGERKDGADAEG